MKTTKRRYMVGHIEVRSEWNERGQYTRFEYDGTAVGRGGRLFPIFVALCNHLEAEANRDHEAAQVLAMVKEEYDQ